MKLHSCVRFKVVPIGPLLAVLVVVFGRDKPGHAARIARILASAMVFSIFALQGTVQAADSEKATMLTLEEYLRKSAVPREVLDRWLRVSSWVTFDPELGYVLGNSLLPWAIDKSSAIETIQMNGARTTIMYANRKPRINTYGDSFTECSQVNDGETWQEYLAGHLGEPVANFGVGGYGVYQAYRRMLREEKTDHAATYLILTICCDDSTRSLYRYRRAVFFQYFPDGDGMRFHGNFWSNLEMDLDTGRFVEKEQLLPTKESLYRMTDPQWMVDHLKDDLALQLTLYRDGLIADVDRKAIRLLAKHLGLAFDGERDEARALLNRYSQRATIFILERIREFARLSGKRLMIVLNGNASVEDMKRGIREDQELVEYLIAERVPYVDMNEIFLRGYRESGLSKAQYMSPYLVNCAGHFNPMGNHFIAYSMKDTLIELLDPKPIPYQSRDAQAISFDGYLRGGVYQ